MTSACSRACFCSAVDKHSLFGFFTVLPPCTNSQSLCKTLRAIHAEDREYLEETASDKRESKGKEKRSNDFITPAMCPRGVMLVCVAFMNFFFYSLWTYVLIARGNNIGARAGSDNDNVAHLASRFGGRDFGEVNDCFERNSRDMTFNAILPTDIGPLTEASGCTLNVINNYLSECLIRDGEAIEPESCKSHGCKDAISNLYACLVAANESTEIYNTLSDCSKEDKIEKVKIVANSKGNQASSLDQRNDTSKRSAKQSNSTKDSKQIVNANENAFTAPFESGVPVTQQQGMAIPKLARCLTADCRSQMRDMLVQLISTIVFTSIMTLVLEKIVNQSYGVGTGGYCCRARCSHRSFVLGFGAFLVMLLFATLIGAFLAAEKALEELQESAPQRCIYSTPMSLIRKLMGQFWPVLGMTWFTEMCTSLAAEWWRRRKMTLRGDEATTEIASKDTEMVTSS